MSDPATDLARRIRALPLQRREILYQLVKDFERLSAEIAWEAEETCPHCGYGRLKPRVGGLRCDWCKAIVPRAQPTQTTDAKEPPAASSPRPQEGDLQPPAQMPKDQRHDTKSETRKERDRAIVDAYLRGDRVKDIAKRHGVSEWTVRKAVRSAGVQLRLHGGQRRAKDTGAKNIRSAEIAAAYLAGRGIGEIAESDGIQPQTVRTHLRNSGVRLRAEDNNKFWNTAFSPPARGRDAAAQAQLTLQRRGYHVYRSAVSGGAEGMWLIDGHEVDEAGLIAAGRRVEGGRSALDAETLLKRHRQKEASDA